MIKSTWVIIPAHNRREITLDCIKHLKETQNWNSLNTIVVDDGSIDGTADAIREHHPDIHLLQGDGSLWWGGAIKQGMEYALDHGGEVFIWLNDDVRPEPAAITKLATTVGELGDTILAAMVFAENNSEYTTRNRKTRTGMEKMPYDTNAEIQYCDATAGKLTAIPVQIVDKIGLPSDDIFPHHHCDYDYTLRAKEDGFDVGVYTPAKAKDIAFETGYPRLSSKASLEEVIKNTFDSSRQANYSIRTRYYQHMRFFGPPRSLGYLIFLYRIVRSCAAILVKMALVLTRKEQRFRK